MTHKWLSETLKIMENDINKDVRDAADHIRKNGNAVLDSRFVNLMSPDGQVKWFQFINKRYDTRTFEVEHAELSDSELHEMDEDNLPALIRNC